MSAVASPRASATPRPAVDRRDLLVVVGLALGLRLLFAALTRDTYDYDEFVILLLARDFAHGAVPYQTFMFFHPPGALVLYRLLQPITALWWPLARLVPMALDTATAALILCIGARLYARREAMAAGVLYAASPLAMVSAVRVEQDPLITFLGVAGLALLLTRSSRRYTVAAGLCLGLAVSTKYAGLYFLPIYFLAAPRRAHLWLTAAAASGALLLIPFLPQAHALYDQTIAFQRTRWSMPIDIRLQTTVLFWLLVNPLAILAVVVRRQPSWLAVGFLLGGIFLFAPQTYYHYFVPVVPFAALAGGPLAVRLVGARASYIAASTVLIAALWAAILDLGGPSPVYVTAAHLSAIAPTIQVLDSRTSVHSRVLGDRFEYAFLAGRPAFDAYFWNVGPLVNAAYLEQRLRGVGSVVLSHGASSGFPPGFTRFLDRRYRTVDTTANVVWMLDPNQTSR